mgnify:CR=1 FL=1
MNQSNIYTYSILSGTWNDLDYEVLLLVKEYLKVHLNRRMLNNDYNDFKKIAETNTPPIVFQRSDPWISIFNSKRNCLRYGLYGDFPMLLEIDELIENKDFIGNEYF